MANAGISGETTVLVAFEATILFFFEATAAGLHAAAYFGLRRFKPWGWIAALIVSAAWSLILVGIPVLVLLLRRPTREAYGIS